MSGTSGRERVTRHERERGAVTAMVAVFLVGLMAAAALVYDGGRAITAKRRAINQAEQAARAGARALDPAALRAGEPDRLDAAEARRQAMAHLDSIGADGTVDVSGTTVEVTVTFREPTLLLGLIGLGSISGSGSADAVSVRGVGEEDP